MADFFDNYGNRLGWYDELNNIFETALAVAHLLLHF